MKRRLRAGEWYGLSLTLSLTVLLLALASFGEIVEDLIDRETLFRLDFQVQHVVERIMTPALTRVMVEVTQAGGVYLTAATAASLFFYLFRRGAWWDLFAFFLAVGAGEALLGLAKLLFHRARPFPQQVAASGGSFPSGHAFAALVVYGFLIHVVWKFTKGETPRLIVSLLSAALILLIGVSRVYLNVHWFTDVLGGYAAGLAWLLLSALMARMVQERCRPA